MAPAGSVPASPSRVAVDWSLLATVGVIAVFVTLNQSAVHWRDDIVDSHYYAYCGWRVAEGARPYLDVWNNKPPATWWMNALGYHLCGPGVVREIVICTTALAATLLAFVWTARRAYSRRVTLFAALIGGLFLTDIRFDGGANRTEPFVVLFETLAVLAYLRWSQRCSRELRFRGGGWLLLAGCAAGAAPLFKQSGLGAAAACAAHLAVWQLMQLRGSRWRTLWPPWALATTGFMLPVALTAGTLATYGALWEGWFAVGPFNQAYFAADDATWIRIPAALRSYAPLLDPLTPVLVLAAVGVIYGGWRRLRAGGDSRTSAVGLFTLWALFSLYLACVGPGRQGHHFLPVLAPLALLAVAPLHAVLSRRLKPGAPAGHAGAIELEQSPARAHRLLPISSAAATAWVYLVLAASAGNFLLLAQIWSKKPHWWALDYAVPRPYQAQAAEIRALTTPDDRIYVWGWSPGTYRFAYRHAVSRFATLEKLGQVESGVEFIIEEAMHALRAQPPRVFVISIMDLQGMRRERSPFARWLLRHYDDRGPIQGMHIMVRRRPAISPRATSR